MCVLTERWKSLVNDFLLLLITRLKFSFSLEDSLFHLLFKFSINYSADFDENSIYSNPVLILKKIQCKIKHLKI